MFVIRWAPGRNSTWVDAFRLESTVVCRPHGLRLRRSSTRWISEGSVPCRPLRSGSCLQTPQVEFALRLGPVRGGAHPHELVSSETARCLPPRFLDRTSGSEGSEVMIRFGAGIEAGCTSPQVPASLGEVWDPR